MTKFEQKIVGYKVALKYINVEPNRSKLILQIDNMEKALAEMKKNPVKKVVKR